MFSIEEPTPYKGDIVLEIQLFPNIRYKRDKESLFYLPEGREKASSLRKRTFAPSSHHPLQSDREWFYDRRCGRRAKTRLRGYLRLTSRSWSSSSMTLAVASWISCEEEPHSFSYAQTSTHGHQKRTVELTLILTSMESIRSKLNHTQEVLTRTTN